MIWKDIFLVATLFVIFTKDYGYLWKLVEMPVRAWSSQQTWILLLLLGLVMFNDPFFSLQVLVLCLILLLNPLTGPLQREYRYSPSTRSSSLTSTSS